MGIKSIRALVVVPDTAAAVERLTGLLRSQGVEVTCVPNAAEALARIPENAPDLVFSEMDHVGDAAWLLNTVRPANGAASLLSVLLLSDESERAAALRLGAHFVLYQPVTLSQVQSVLLATRSLMSRERRRTTRVPIQIPVTLGWQDAENVEGILLDVSESGMDVLISKPVPNFTDLAFRFALPHRLAPVEGRGVVAVDGRVRSTLRDSFRRCAHCPQRMAGFQRACGFGTRRHLRRSVQAHRLESGSLLRRIGIAVSYGNTAGLDPASARDVRWCGWISTGSASSARHGD